MTTDQIILFTLFAAVFGMLLWGRFRYDLVAFAALMVAVVLGVVDSKDAFAGDVLFLLRLPRAAIRTDQKLQFDLAHGIKFGHVYSVCRDRPSRRVPL
mgnify:CR=1 FL=1